MSITDVKEISYNLCLLPPTLWSRLSELSRLRIENRVIRAIGEGKRVGGITKGGVLATWAKQHFQYFSLKDQVGDAFIKNLREGCLPSIHYVIELFLLELPLVISEPIKMWICVSMILDSIRSGDQIIRRKLLAGIYSLPQNWRNTFNQVLKKMTEGINPPIYLQDGSLFEKLFDDEDDVPF
jgi:hypothetical protein